MFEYRKATLDDFERIWDMNIVDHGGDIRWVNWKNEAVLNNKTGRSSTFVVICNGKPVGEETLLFSPECGAIRGRTELADNKRNANINALRIRKAYEGQGHISALVKLMENYALENGYTRLTIGVEAKETRNLAIYPPLGLQ